MRERENDYGVLILALFAYLNLRNFNGKAIKIGKLIR